MTRQKMIIVSNGDTEDYVRVDFEACTLGGKKVLAFMHLLIPGTARNFDSIRKVWFVKSGLVDGFLAAVRTITNKGHTLEGYTISDQRIVYESFEEFFTEQPPTNNNSESKESLIRKFLDLLSEANIQYNYRSDTQMSECKPWYRKAALALHPDRNNGDGTKMAELNRVWILLNK